MDVTTRRDWESMNTINKLPTLDELVNFLNERRNLLESIQSKNVDVRRGHATESSSVKRDKISSLTVTETVKYKCFICEGNHSAFQCEQFKVLSAEERIELVKQKGLCFNCLRAGHTSQQCKSRTCQRCNKHHHTLLHKEKPKIAMKITSKEANLDNSSDEQSTIACASQMGASSKQVLLSTACVMVRDKSDNNFVLRALMDNGSQSNFISKKAYELLRLNKRNIHIEYRITEIIGNHQ
ncbi:uncharacterized protein [Onthophagus taurus]|uniref:uncharacterized protein n=1 Tax=Onthophagus taurus TaxID=166361 RepID=UPI0039BDB9B1